MTQAGFTIGLDVGTQSTKALVVDGESRTVVARASRSHGLIEGLPEGAAEQHPHTWRDAVRDVLAEVLADGVIDHARLTAIAVSGQQHGSVFLDADGEVIRPAKLWCDTTTAAEAAELSSRVGRNIPSGFTAPKILWLERHEPDSFDRLRTVLLPHDYINLLLTKRCFMEAGDASGTGLLDITTRAFDRAAADAVDPRVHDMLPELVAPDAPAGTVSDEAARYFGLPAGMLVAPGGGDNMMSAIGSGATRPGVTVVSLGTSGTAFAYSDTPIIDPDGDIAAFCDSTGGWLPLLCTMNATTVTEEVVRLTGDLGHDELTRLAALVDPGADGVLFLPYLAGERVPNLPDATGTLLGLRPGSMTPGVLYRAAMEGATLAIAAGIERMKDLGVSLDRVRLVGGGARNPLWRQITADVLGVPVERLAEPESAAFGAALQACWIHGRASGSAHSADDVAAAHVEVLDDLTRPDMSHHQRYRAHLRRFRQATDTLFA